MEELHSSLILGDQGNKNTKQHSLKLTILYGKWKLDFFARHTVLGLNTILGNTVIKVSVGLVQGGVAVFVEKENAVERGGKLHFTK